MGRRGALGHQRGTPPPPPPPCRALENQYFKARVVRLFAVDFVMEPLSPSSSAMILSEMLTGLFLCEQIAQTELRELQGCRPSGLTSKVMTVTGLSPPHMDLQRHRVLADFWGLECTAEGISLDSALPSHFTGPAPHPTALRVWKDCPASGPRL